MNITLTLNKETALDERIWCSTVTLGYFEIKTSHNCLNNRRMRIYH